GRMCEHVHMRAIIYTRVSNDHSGRSTSTDDQERECRELCRTRDWDVAEVLCDDDIGASRWSSKDRPAYRRLADVLRSGDVLVTWEASRAQRDLAAYVELRDLCAERGVAWCYSGRLYDLSHGDDRFSTGLDALLAEKEAEQIRERVLRGKRASALAGRPAGRAPYGYRPVRDPRTGRTESWELMPEQAAILREAAQRILGGESGRSVCADFTARDIPTPTGSAWLSQRLRVMLVRPAVAGLREHRGEVVGPGRWPAILDRDTWDRLCALYRDPDRRMNDSTEVKHLLSGIAVCGVCGATVRYFDPPSARSKHINATYVCSTSAVCVRRRVDRADEMVSEFVIATLEGLSPSAFTRDDPAAAAAHEELVALQSRLDAFTDEAASGGLSASALARIEAKLLPQIAEARRRASVSPMPIPGDALGPAARDYWGRASVSERRALVRALASVTILRSTVRGPGSFDPGSIVIKLAL
ncbi:recombinase family protein, partial [Gordonia sp. NPDC003376]